MLLDMGFFKVGAIQNLNHSEAKRENLTLEKRAKNIYFQNNN